MKKKYDDDDGRIIADMNVGDAPWTDGSRFDSFRIIPKFNRRRYISPEAQHNESYTGENGKSHLSDMTNKEYHGTLLSAILAGLLVVLVLSVGFALFLLFCLKIWFKY